LNLVPLLHRNLKNISRIKPQKIKKWEKLPKVGEPQTNTNTEYCATENVGGKFNL
jgi:hypothetical protein